MPRLIGADRYSMPPGAALTGVECRNQQSLCRCWLWGNLRSSCMKRA